MKRRVGCGDNKTLSDTRGRREDSVRNMQTCVGGHGSVRAWCVLFARLTVFCACSESIIKNVNYQANGKNLKKAKA